MADHNRKADSDRDPETDDKAVDQKVHRESEDIQRKAEKDANPLAPPVNTRAS